MNMIADVVWTQQCLQQERSGHKEMTMAVSSAGKVWTQTDGHGSLQQDRFGHKQMTMAVSSIKARAKTD